MARAWVDDLWVKDAKVTLSDGTTQRVKASSAQTRSISSLPEQFRTTRWGTGKRWRVSWYEEGTLRGKLFEKRRDAEEFQSELEDDIRRGRYIDPSYSNRTFTDLADTWLASKSSIKDSTYRRYRRDLDSYVIPRWGKTPIGSIKREDIDIWIQSLGAGTAPRVSSSSKHVNASKREPRSLSPASIDGIVRVAFGAPLRYAVNNHWIGRNPFVGVELPRNQQEHGKLPSLTYEQIEELAEKAYDLTGEAVDRHLIHILSYVGLRIGEATALRVGDLDMENNRLRVQRTWTVDKEGVRKIGRPKTGAARIAPVPQFMAKELKVLIRDREPEEYLLRSSRESAINGGNWRERVWAKIRENTAAASLTVHDLRHVAATLAIAANADVKLVQNMLGHKDASETLNTYAELWPNKVDEVMSLIEDRRALALKENYSDSDMSNDV